MTVSMGNLTKIVRDHLYDETGPGGKRASVGITVEDMLTEVNSIRGTNTSGGAIRRSLRELRKAKVADFNDMRRPAVYKWRQGEPQPSDYTPRGPQPKGQTSVTTPSTAPNPNPQTDDEKREVLRGKLKNRMNEITGENKKKEEEEKVPVAKKNARKGIKRHNGQFYQPRDLAGVADIDFLRRLRDKGIYTLLSGPPGTGKTVLVDAAFNPADGSQPGGMFTVTADENTNVDDFLGQWSPTGIPTDPYVWVDGPLIDAMNSGGVLFIDDATLANPKVLAVVYPAMDGRGEVVVKSHVVCVNCQHKMHHGQCSCSCSKGREGKPHVVKSQPGFYVAAAHNPGVHGAILTDALSSRFIAQIWVETDLELAASLGVGMNFLKLVKALRIDRDKGQPNIWIPQLRELLAARDIAKSSNEMIAAQNLLGVAPEDDREWIQSKMKVIFGSELKILELGGQL